MVAKPLSSELISEVMLIFYGDRLNGDMSTFCFVGLMNCCSFFGLLESTFFYENLSTVNFDLYGLVSISPPAPLVINGERDPLLSKLWWFSGLL